MENRDRDNMRKNVNSSGSSNLDKSKGDSQSNFGKNIGRSEDLTNEPSRRSGSVDNSGMKGSTGRSSSSQSSSDLGSSDISSSSDSSSRGSNTGSRH